MEKLFDKVKYFVLDLDGTVYIDGTLIGDMKNTLATIRKSGRTIVYLTNNSSRSIADYITRLTNIGIYEEGDIMFSSGVAVTAYLKEHYAGKKVHLKAEHKPSWKDAILPKRMLRSPANRKVLPTVLLTNTARITTSLLRILQSKSKPILTNNPKIFV